MVEGIIYINFWQEYFDKPSEIRRADPYLELFTDASLLGWGVVQPDFKREAEETDLNYKHINTLVFKTNSFWFKEAV